MEDEMQVYLVKIHENYSRGSGKTELYSNWMKVEKRENQYGTSCKY